MHFGGQALTNSLKLAASTIAKIYKQRRQIEIFFKALKQNFKIKTLVDSPPLLRASMCGQQ